MTMVRGRGTTTPRCGTPSTRARAAVRYGGRRFVRGQTLAVLLPLLAILVTAFWWVLEAGEAAVEKQRLRDTADVAALAGAVWQAKVQNFDAYTNRAIVANEAFIAQAVSLRGWSEYIDQLLPRASLITAPVPYLGPVMTALQRSWSAINRALQPTLQATETTTSALNHEIAAAQRVMHLSVPIVLPQLVRAVVERNDPRYRITAGGESQLIDSATAWQDYASFYGGSFRWRQLDVIERSMDGFSYERNWSLGLLPGGPLGRLEKRAGTNLVNFDTWRSIDTLAMHQRRYLIFGRMREVGPIAWAALENGRRTALRGTHGGAYVTNPRTARLAEAQMRHGSGYFGLPSMYDLSAVQRAAFDPPVVSVRIALPDEQRRGASSLFGFSTARGIDGKTYSLTESGGAREMIAESAATTSFSRPVPRADGGRELPSLYNAYWRPRLTRVPLARRLKSATLDGDPLWLAAVPR